MKIRHGRTVIVALAAFAASAAVAAAQELLPPNAGRGGELWAKCRACHTIDKGARHIVGPNLHGLFGRRAGALHDYRYSEALKNSGIVWNDASLDRYLAATQDVVPGGKMYGGLAIAQDRLDLITWLKSTTRD